MAERLPCTMLRRAARLITAALLAGTAVAAPAAKGGSDRSCGERRYTFSWPLQEGCAMQPRGGTTRGPEVTLERAPSAAWKAIGEAGLSDFERDRRAILAMAGEYRVTFDFLETVGLVPDHEPAAPYQSWATELVLVAEDRGNFIRLQHIIVMTYVDENGDVQGPVVQKHWRQDWHYQGRDVLRYAGQRRWAQVKLDSSTVNGTWTQTVHQVDDSPRYGGFGRWDHRPNFSTWVSDETWRPLPRREHSVRSDYHVLVGTNRHTITPTGWVHEELNYKMRLDDEGRPDPTLPYLAREIGLNRYERVTDFDFSAGREYWRATEKFWGDVAAYWNHRLTTQGSVALRADVNGQPMFMPLFGYAERLRNDRYSTIKGRAFIDETLADYLR